MDQGIENTSPTVLTASTLDGLIDKLEAATPPNKIAVCVDRPKEKDGVWSVDFTLKDRIV